MPDNHHQQYPRGISRRKLRAALGLSLAGIWLGLFFVSKPPEGERDWPSLIAMLVVTTAVYTGLWYVAIRAATAKRDKSAATGQQQAATTSRAQLIYGKQDPEDDSDDEPQ